MSEYFVRIRKKCDRPAAKRHMKGKYKQPIVGTCILENVYAICCHSEGKKTSLSRQSLCLNEMVGGGGGKREGGCQGFTVLHLCSRANTSLSIATDSCLHLLMQSNLNHCKNCQCGVKHTQIT